MLPLNRVAAASVDGQTSRRGVDAIAGAMLPFGSWMTGSRSTRDVSKRGWARDKSDLLSG